VAGIGQLQIERTALGAVKKAAILQPLQLTIRMPFLSGSMARIGKNKGV
jgi:hypothetical protein